MDLHLTEQQPWIRKAARAGLSAKGFIYLLLGLLAFMAAFEIGGQQTENTTPTGALETLHDWPAGKILLIVLTAGLICYTVWRFVQAANVNENSDKKKWMKRIRYAFSALSYLAVAFSAVQILQNSSSSSGGNESRAATVLSQPFGQWLLGIGALVMAGVGIYQIWYGWSGGYRKHINRHPGTHGNLLLKSGTIGYVSRGIVWLIIAYLLLRAALNANAGEAGDTSEAFILVERGTAGSLLLGALGIGLCAYGIFNFLRARYEDFKN